MNDQRLIIPQYDGVNLAPLKPLLDLRDTGKLTPHKFNDAVKERFNHFLELQKRAWQDIHQGFGLIDLMISGKQRLQRNPYGGWISKRIEGETSESQGPINLMRFYEENIISKYVSSHPDVEVLPGNNYQQTIDNAKNANYAIDHYEEKLFDEFYDQKDGRLLLRGGTIISRFRWDNKIRGIVALKEIFGDKEVQIGDGHAKCYDCNQSGVADQFGWSGEQEWPDYKCPQCGSNAVDVVSPAKQSIKTVVGQEQTNIGDIAVDQWALPSCKWDLSVMAEESSWFIHRQRTTLSAIHSLVGEMRVPGDTNDNGLSILESLATVGMPIAGRRDRKSVV